MIHSQADAIVAGHLCLDVIPDMGNLCGDPALLWRPGTLHQVGKAVLATGGAVSNTGISLNRLGIKTKLLGKVGDDPMGKIVRDLLGTLGDSVIVSPGQTTSYSLVLSPANSDRLFLHHSGANDTCNSDDFPLDSLKGARLFHFGYPPNMRSFYMDGGEHLYKLFSKARAQGLTTSLDMTQPDRQSDAGRIDWLSLLRRVLPLVDLFMPSLDEISFMLGIDASRPTIALLDEIANQLLGMGPPIVGLKLGDQGLYLRTSATLKDDWSDRQLLSPCFEVNVAGTTGSGDSTIAGFLAAWLNGLSPQAAMTIAVGVGACCVERADATSGVPTWQELQNRLSHPWPRKAIQFALEGWNEKSFIWIGPDDHKERR
jgi:sugar/nucleoside kinase (ribokinase family)